MDGIIGATSRIVGIKKGRMMRPLIVLRFTHCQNGKVIMITKTISVNALYASSNISLISSMLLPSDYDK
jgi:hypothetical protein